jgi:hypothetical protein
MWQQGLLAPAPLAAVGHSSFGVSRAAQLFAVLCILTPPFVLAVGLVSVAVVLRLGMEGMYNAGGGRPRPAPTVVAAALLAVTS